MDYFQAWMAVKERLENMFDPLIEDGTIKEFLLVDKVRGTYETPYLQGLFYDDVIDLTTMGSLGNDEAWDMDFRLVACVKESDNPIDGVIEATRIISLARNLMLEQRQLGIPTVVRTVNSSKINRVPFPLGKKRNLYAVGSIFLIKFMIDNQID